MPDDDTTLLRTMLQETRANIVRVVLAHPQNAPSLAELDCYIPNKSKSTVRDHLDVLIESGVLSRVKLPSDERTRDNPHAFYVLTKWGWRVLNRHGMSFASRDTLRGELAAFDKPARIRRFQSAPRPDLSPDDRCYVNVNSGDDQ